MAVPVVAGSVDDSHDIVMFAGHVIVGAVLSMTVINCVPLAILLHASMADHDLTIVPVPLHPVSPRTLSEKTTFTDAVQLSVAVAAPVMLGSVV